MRKKRTRALSILCLMVVLSCSVTGFGVSLPIAETQKASAKAFDKKKAKKNITVKYAVKDEGILATYTNKNSFTVSFTATMKYIDFAGNVIGQEKIKNFAFGKKRKMVYFFKSPLSGDNKIIPYHAYKGAFSVKKATYKDYSSKISITPTVGPTSCDITVMNKAPITLTSINATFLFYDASGTYICARNLYIGGCKNANTAQDLTLNYAEYNRHATKVKMFVNWAY